jgi:hypothetical protein
MHASEALPDPAAAAPPGVSPDVPTARVDCDGPEPFRVDGGRVPGDWIDYNGHTVDASYAIAFSKATTALLAWFGIGSDVGRSDRVPVTPAQIADAAIEAAKAGAAVAHVHVRDPATGRGSRDLRLYREVVERVRSADVDVVLNLTAGVGGDLVLGGGDAPLPLDASGTDMAGAEERLRHVADLLPEICTLDCVTMNFAAGDYVMVNTPTMLRVMAERSGRSVCGRSSRCSTQATSSW